jgi:hypothetical protein
MGFDEQFEEITRDLTSTGGSAVDDAAAFRAAHELVEGAMLIIRETAPPGLPGPHAWLGAIQIVSQFAHQVAHDALDEERP